MKAKKATRLRVDSQQSSLDYYWNGARNQRGNGCTHSNKRRKVGSSKDSHSAKHPNSNVKDERKLQESDDGHDDDDDDDDDEDEDHDLDMGDVSRQPQMAYLAKKQVQKRVIPRPECVDRLIQMIDQNGDENLKKVFSENVFVGCIDSVDPTLKLKDTHKENVNEHEFITNTFQRVLFQYDTKLFLCNIHRISRVYFFELCIKNIGKFRSIYKLVPAIKREEGGGMPTIYDLIVLALELEESRYDEEEAGPKEEVAHSVADTLCQPAIARILRDYFCIDIDAKEQSVRSIPCLIDGYVPGLLYLPIFLLRLVTEIQWFKEEESDHIEVDITDQNLFKQIAMEIARFYQIRPPQFYLKGDGGDDEEQHHEHNGHQRFGGRVDKKERGNKKEDLEWILQHVIFRSMNKKCTKYSFHPPRFLCNDGSIVQIACTKQLYRVFERC